jgi:hypothetical protein
MHYEQKPSSEGFFLSPAPPNPSRATLHNVVIQRIAHRIPIVVVFINYFSQHKAGVLVDLMAVHRSLVFHFCATVMNDDVIAAPEPCDSILNAAWPLVAWVDIKASALDVTDGFRP